MARQPEMLTLARVEEQAVRQVRRESSSRERLREMSRDTSGGEEKLKKDLMPKGVILRV
jgi:hypothetical protein